MKQKSSRGIIMKNNKILLIHRITPIRDYYVIPGGKIEGNESPEQGLIREIKEETNLDIISFKKWTEIEDEKRYAYYFIIDRFIGNPEIIGEEKDKHSLVNQYILEWIEISKLKKLNLVPIKIKEKIINLF